ncbi:MAG: non-canonical purine NTP diphosphatase [Bacteroidales bacterium]|nr:non-canonical purine NTP diphosphatase [Bacteroidales bacterium]
MELVFATNNKHKLEEIQNALGDKLKLLSLKDISFFEEIPEDFETLKENAQQKARHIFDRYKINCFADDTGLEIDSLNGAPGVYSARYAGESCSFEDNVQKVLKELDGVKNRKAQFRTVISLILNGKEYFFEGSVNGEILTENQGVGGFGYDPIFKPIGFDKSFAEMGLDEKNKISHRGRAAQKLVDFLLNQ